MTGVIRALAVVAATVCWASILPRVSLAQTPSPVGKIVYVGSDGVNFDIFVMNADGTGVIRLTTDGNNNHPEWSPDGGRIVFDNFSLFGVQNIYVMNADGTSVIPLTAQTFSEGANFQPTWAPDGNSIVFVSTRDGNGGYELYSMGADGASQTRLTNTILASDEWQPDVSSGGRIAFASDRANTPFERFDIYVMEADGTGVTRLTFDGGDPSDPTAPSHNSLSPAWSPDGTRIAFDSTRSGDREVWVINADGTGLVNVSNDPGQDYEPAWSPDGTQIIFTSDRAGETDIWAVDAPPVPAPAAALRSGEPPLLAGGGAHKVGRVFKTLKMYPSEYLLSSKAFGFRSGATTFLSAAAAQPAVSDPAPRNLTADSNIAAENPHWNSDQVSNSMTDLQITKSGPQAVLNGDQITYRFRVTNNGPNTATGVTLTDALPAGVSLVSAAPSTGACSGTTTVTCTFNDLPAGASDTVRLVVTPTATGTLTNTATVSGNEPDPNPANDTAEQSAVVVPLLLDLNPQTVSAACQTSTTAAISLSGPAPAGGAAVALMSTNPAAAAPSSVTIPEGETSASFTIPISAVTTTQRGKVTASYNGASFSRLLTVRPANIIRSLTLTPSPVVGGGSVTGAVTLVCAAASDTVISLSSSDPAAAKPVVPSITIPAGQATGTFTISTADVSAVSYPVITAEANGYGVKRKLRVKP